MTERPEDLLIHGPVTLRRYRADDLDALTQAVSESADHLRPWLPWVAGHSRESEAEFLAQTVRDWESGAAYNYAITAEGGVLVGGSALMSRIGPGGLEIGYWVHRDWTRRGLATAASAALVAAAFGLPGVDRIEIVHDELNLASAGVPRKLGFTQVARRPLAQPPPAGTGTGLVWRLTR
jgi:ribosomal-protein-serine acetyltransferase